MRSKTVVMVLVLTLFFWGAAICAAQGQGAGQGAPQAQPAEQQAPQAQPAEQQAPQAQPAAPAKQEMAKVNINTADEATLAKLPGVGKKLAKQIIAYREKNGPFKTIEDIKKVKGIGPKTFNKIKGHITVE